jgi:cyclophilin family peptidyl-prolyl cis-trans isomerase
MRLILLFCTLLMLPGVETALAAPPAAPSNVTLTAPYVSRVRLTWQDNSDNETGFEISYRIGTSGAFTALSPLAADRTSIDLSGAIPLTTYQFQVRSFINPGPEYSEYAGPATATATGFIDPPALAAPVVAGTAPGAQNLAAGGTPVVIPIGGLFNDPDVSSAARLTTDLGILDFAFYPDSAPLTVANFLSYLERGDFANTFFHRSVTDFIVQAGAFRADATASAVPTTLPVVNEPLITNVRGTVAMAKTPNNPNSATNQFFINLANNASNLNNQNGGFTVFARVAGNGMAVADAIDALPTRSYTTVNSNLTDTPVRGTPPAVYDPTTLVRISTAEVIPPLTLGAESSAPDVATVSLTGTNLTVTPLAPGTSTITLTATDLDAQSINTTFSVTVAPPDAYDIWAGQQSFAQPSDAEPGADPDQDGGVNLMEFALHSAPLAASSNPLVPAIDGNHLTLTFPLRSILSGTTVTLQSAASLAGPWNNQWTANDGFTHPWIATTEDLGSYHNVTAKDPEPLSPARQFLRLQVTRP